MEGPSDGTGTPNEQLERAGETQENGRGGLRAARVSLTWKKRVVLVGFGLIVALILLEILLRTVGFVYYYEKRYTPGNHPDDAFVILCLGDSCTQGLGASNERKFSYPAQLQTILNRRHPDRKFRVVNMGFGGANSSQLARRLEGFIRLHKPDLAIVLIGNNDVWNQNESLIYLVGEGRRAKFSRRLRARLRMWSDELRVVRLARCIALSLDDDRDRRWNPDEDTSPSRRRFKKGREILGRIERVQELYRLNFKRISSTARKWGVELLWLDYHKHARFRETDYIDPVLEEMGAVYADLAPYFRSGDSYKEELLAGDGWHPNDLGYAVYARVAYNKLVEMGYAPGPQIDVLDQLAPHE